MCSVTGIKPPSGPFTCQEKQPSPTTLEEKEEEKERNRQGEMERQEGGGRLDGEKQKQEDRERRSTRRETREPGVKQIVCSQCRGQG